jgi:hypothetical protein
MRTIVQKLKPVVRAQLCAVRKRRARRTAVGTPAPIVVEAKPNARRRP